MKKIYVSPSINVADILLYHNISVNSIQGEGVGYGGGADPSTGRVKGRDEYVEYVDGMLDEMANDDMANQTIMW
jgi:hypothetical protein